MRMLKGSCDFVLTRLVKQDVLWWDGLISDLTGAGPVCEEQLLTAGRGGALLSSYR